MTSPCEVAAVLFGITVASARDKALLDLSLEPPLINTAPGPEYDDQVRPGNMIIGIDRKKKKLSIF